MGTDTKECGWKKIRNDLFQHLVDMQLSKICLSDYNWIFILLAQKFGIRSGDIAKLKYSDINFHKKTIEFIQEKTLVPHQLELLPEVEDALSEYLKARRAGCNFEYIFLRVIPPFIRITRGVVANVVRKAFKVSGTCIAGKKHDPHSLRMTLASELVSENVPYMVVGKILGHEDPNAAKHLLQGRFRNEKEGN